MAVVEVITFRAAAGADDSAVQHADEHVQTEFAYQQRGLVRRTTARGANGEWLVVQLWQSAGDADAAASAARTHASFDRLLRLIDHATLRVARYETLD